MRMELDENIAAGEGEVVGEANRGDGGVEGGQDEVPGFDEDVDSVQGEEVNVEEDVVGGEGEDESNEDVEDEVAVVEKAFFYLVSIWPLGF